LASVHTPSGVIATEKRIPPMSHHFAYLCSASSARWLPRRLRPAVRTAAEPALRRSRRPTDKAGREGRQSLARRIGRRRPTRR
jgi:hypothetical protein